MPNHVHVLATPLRNYTLSSILHTWKSFTAHQANKLLGRRGTFWMVEYFDRAIRNERHFANVVEYIEHNPVKAGLCDHPMDWKWSSANTNAWEAKYLGAQASRLLMQTMRTGRPRSQGKTYLYAMAAKVQRRMQKQSGCTWLWLWIDWQ